VLTIRLRSLRWIADLRLVTGILIVALMVLPWFVAIGMLSHGTFFRDSLGHDVLGKLGAGQESHGLPPGSYLLAFPLSAWPMSAFVLLALPFILRNWRKPAIFFCLAWAVPAWIVFEAAATKLPHYVLPLFPPLALLAGAAIDQAKLAGVPWRAFLGLILPLLPLAIIVGAIVLPPRIGEAIPVVFIVVAAVAFLVAAAGYIALLRRADALAVLAAVPVAALLYGGVYGLALPGFGGLWLSRSIVAAADAASTCGPPRLAAAGYQEPSLVVAAGTGTLFAGTGKVADWLAGPGCRMAAVASDKEADFREAAAKKGLLLAAAGTVQGFDYVHGRPATIRLYRAAGPSP
jgi:4-amino-4-deoxy-L-arabinose transferase-like glycosyltransferase